MKNELEKYYREKTNNENPMLSRQVRECLKIASIFMEEQIENKVNETIENLGSLSLVKEIKKLKRFDIDARIDDYSENHYACLDEHESELGEWVRWSDVKDLLNKEKEEK